MVEVLKGEGIQRSLREVICHGIAMCDHCQEETKAEEAEEGATKEVAAAAEEAEEEDGAMTGREAAASLQLLMESLSR